MTQAESLVDQLDKKDAQVRALSVIAYAQHRVRARKQADRLVGEAIDRAQQIEDPRRRSDAICEAAAALRMMGKSDDSATMFDKALEASRTIDDNVSQAHGLALEWLGRRKGTKPLG